MREHENDVPGDIVGEEAEDLPGGFGVDDPDKDAENTIDEFYRPKILQGTDRITTEAQGNSTIAGETEPQGEGATVSYRDLLEGEEGHPGAAVGFTGEEKEKRVLPETEERKPKPPTGLIPEGGTPTEVETEQQLRNQSVESEGPFGDQGKKAA